MKQDLQEFNLQNREALIGKLINSGYAFACWKMPNQGDNNFIISLDGCELLSALNLSELTSGFMINGFEKSHPIEPLFLKADLKLRDNKFDISPFVSDEQVDKFMNDLEQNSHGNESGQFSNSREEEPTETRDFIDLIAKSIEQIKDGYFEKVVVSRFKDESINKHFKVWEYFELLCAKYQNAFCSLTFIPNQGLWIGASPELLISESEESFKTVSLASTKRLEPGQDLSEIAWTQKEIEEQVFVSRYVINCFKKLRLREFHEYGPKTIKAGSLAHLKTTFEVKYNEVRFEKLADQMLELLHPTSAVCGMPIENAKPWILNNEHYDREFYSGFLGPVNFEGETNLFVNLRCAKIENGVMRLYAGAGITEDSNPEREYEETEMKIDVLRNLLSGDGPTSEV